MTDESAAASGERLAGFDVREASPEWSARWHATFPDNHLYRRDIAWSCSVDPLVWPSVLPDPWDASPACGKTPTASGLQNLAANLDEVAAWAEKHLNLDRATVVSVGIDGADWTGEQQAAWERRLYSCQGGYMDFWASLALVPDGVQPGWRLLGHDVADSWLTGGLSNCGLAGVTSEPYRSRVASQLNRLHLFDCKDDAREFAAFAGREVPEHAPFFVYSLWWVGGRLPGG